MTPNNFKTIISHPLTTSLFFVLFIHMNVSEQETAMSRKERISMEGGSERCQELFFDDDILMIIIGM